MNVFDKLKKTITDGHSRTVSVKKNILASIGLKGISILVSFLLVPATIGYVSSELYGVWLTLSSIIIWVQFLDIGFTQGLKNKLTEALARNELSRAKSLVSTTYMAMIMIFTPITILGCFITPYIQWSDILNISSQYESQLAEVMQLMIIMVGLHMIVNVIVSVVAAYQQVAMSQVFLVIGNVIAYITIIILTHTVPPSLVPLSIALAGSPIVVTIIGTLILFSKPYKAVSPNLKDIDFKLIKDLFSLGAKFFIINVQVVVVYQSTNLLIANVSSPEAVTSYNIAYKYLNIAMFLYTNITIPLWPAYTDAYAKGDKDWMISIRNKMNKILLLCSACCIIFAVISPLVYSIWIGDRAYVPAEMTWMVTAYVIVYCYMNLNGTLIIGIGKVKLESIVVLIGMIIYIPIALGLAHWLHEYGVILALILLNLAYGIVFNIQTNKLLQGSATGIWNK